MVSPAFKSLLASWASSRMLASKAISYTYTQLNYVDEGARNSLVPNHQECHGLLLSLGALNMAALQWMYGINDQTATKDVHRLPLKNQEGIGWQCICDTGGIDRIDG